MNHVFLCFCLQCPPCKSFTPKLIACYNKILAKGKSFEIIFVSSDRGEEGFNNYFKDMPWLAVPFGHDVCKQLSAKFSVQGEKKVIKGLRVVSLSGGTFESEDNPVV